MVPPCKPALHCSAPAGKRRWRGPELQRRRERRRVGFPGQPHPGWEIKLAPLEAALPKGWKWLLCPAPSLGPSPTWRPLQASAWQFAFQPSWLGNSGPWQRVGKGGRCNWRSQPLPVFTTPSIPSLLDARGVAADPQKGDGGVQRLLSKINVFFPEGSL